ncbi:NUC173 domain, putative [Babesia ovis]|uniref:NUC173 domain, putative n=1 Tax=Babesia ovis TaxID=5869 RepID=A0A9W5TEC0_BABOV|nr:NUC173 domain, putative [Babesia ovis]
MAQQNLLHIVANLVKRIQRSNALGYDALADKFQSTISEEDVAMCEENLESGRFEKVKQCALDSLVLIQGSVVPLGNIWNVSISSTDMEAARALCPIVKCALDCIANQLDEVLRKAAQYKETTDDTSTLTFEGLFLIARTGLEMINPAVLTVENTLLSLFIDMLNKATAVRPLLNMCMACLTVYLCRLLSADVQPGGCSGLKTILAQLKNLFEFVLTLAISNDGEWLNNSATSLLKLTLRTTIHRIGILTAGGKGSSGNTQVIFLTKVVDCWYGVLVTRIMKLRAEMVISNTKHLRLAKLMQMLATFPPLPPAHRLRLVLQIALTLKQDASCLLQAEILTTLTALMDIDYHMAGDIVRNNVRPLAEAIIELLFDPRFCGNSHGATATTDCNRQVQLVYCVAQCIRTSRSVPREQDAKYVDEFLQKQIFMLLHSDTTDHSGEAARVERLMKETQDMEELQSDYPTLEDFMASRDDCQLLTKLAKMFQYLFTYSNRELDEAIALVICWVFGEFDFGLCLKMLAPLCLHFLRTKRSKMLDGIHNASLMPQGVASMVETATTRWVLGGRIFYNALEAYRDTRANVNMEVDTSDTVSQEVTIFKCIFEATMDIAKEAGGILPKDLEDCIGLYIRTFGFETYLRLMPLEPLYSLPISSDSFRSESHVYMMPVLQRQLKGVPLIVFVKYIMPVLKNIEELMRKTKDCAANLNNEVTLAFVMRSYEALVCAIYSILISMASSATDCRVALEANDYELLKHTLELLDDGPNRAVVACRILGACTDLEGMGPRLIGLLVKRFVALETTHQGELANLRALEEALLSAIANCGRFCESKMLGENLESFESALQRSNCSFDPLIKISRALLPSVDDELKCKLHHHWVDLLKKGPSKNLYLALKRSCETLASEIKKQLSGDGSVTLDPAELTANIPQYVKDICSLEGLRQLSEALHLVPDAKPQAETEEHGKHRIGCIESYTRLLETIKESGLWNAEIKEFVETIVKPLILEAMLNASAPNNSTRASALGIYDGVCNLKLEEIGDILKLSVSAMTSGATKAMQAVLVRCLTRLMARHSEQAVKYNLTQVFSFVFRLLSEDNQKLYVQLLKFARVCIVKLNQEQVLWLAPMLMKLFDNQNCCQRSKVYVRRVVQKLMVKLSRDQMIKIFPQEHLPLMRHVLTAQRHKRNQRLRRALKPSEEDGDDDEQFIDNMFRTDDEGRLLITLDENEETEQEDAVYSQVKSHRHKTKAQHQIKKKAKKSDIQPYAYIKLNRSKTAEKHKRDNIKTLKAIAKPKVKSKH